MTDFKVGDRVRDLNPYYRGEGTVIGILPKRAVAVRFDSFKEYLSDEDAHTRVPTDLELVETDLARQAREYKEATGGKTFPKLQAPSGVEDDEPSEGPHQPFVDAIKEFRFAQSFRDQVRSVLQGVESTLVEKNESYGDSALNPVRIFSSASADEQLRVRIDDKLSRLARGSDFEDEDTVTDLIGYLVLLKIAQKRENA